jgi:hypothetical protein
MLIPMKQGFLDGKAYREGKTSSGQQLFAVLILKALLV